MASEHREREDKYDVDAAFVMPALDSAVPGSTVDVATVALSNLYYDTDGHDLRRNRLTLRRRTGTGETGWQLKLPSGAARTEVSVPLEAAPSGAAADGPTSAGAVPAELAGLLHGVRRARALDPVARLDAERTVYLVRDAAGQVVVEVADDNVRATAIGSPPHSIATSGVTLTQWREVEVEAGPAGSEEALQALGELLTAAGATRSTRASKLETVLGALPALPPLTAQSTVGDAVTAYVQAQVAAIVAGELGLRRGQDVVHPTRVAIRRLRSTLRIFAPVFDGDAAAELETDLVWLAGLLGGVRDADVLRKRLHTLVDAQPPELVLGPVRARIDSDLLAQRSQHAASLHEQLDSARMLVLLDRLEQFRTAPPLTVRAEGDAKALAGYLKRARRKLRERVARAVGFHAASQSAQVTAGSAQSPASTVRSLAHAEQTHHEEEFVHAARKAGKRFRYAAELAAPVLGDAAKDQVRRGEALQDLLGEHQDIVVSVATLRRMGVAAGATPGENGFTFGLLVGGELARGNEIRNELATTRL